MKHFVIVYHVADLDGHSSAILLYDYLTNGGVAQDDDVIVFQNINYGRDAELDFIPDNSIVYIADWSPTPEAFEKLVGRCEKVHWYDHHDSSIRKYFTSDIADRLEADKRSIYHNGIKIENTTLFHWLDDVNFYLGYGKSGVGLVYHKHKKHFEQYGDDFETKIRLISNYDIGRSDEMELNFFFFMECFNFNPTKGKYQNFNAVVKFYEVMELKLEDCLNRGELVRTYVELKNRTNTAINGREAILIIDEKEYPVFVCGGLSSSVGFGEAFEKYQYCITARFTKNGELSMSCYSKNNDSTVISKSFGGGGHKGASGFRAKSYSIDNDDYLWITPI